MTRIHNGLLAPMLLIRFNRTVYAYQEKSSIARMREGHANCKTQSLKTLFKDAHTRDLISDHAYRRVQLFYHTAVVYYNEKCLVGLDKTIAQIGKSECSCCSAAHSAIHPRIWDNSKTVLSKEIRKNPYNHVLLTKFKAMGFKKHKQLAKSSKRQIQKLFKEFLKTQSDRLIKRGHQTALDSTVVVPRVVNEYDCILEQHVRPIALGFLQSVSYGVIEPYKATELFVNTLVDFFEESARATSEVKELVEKLNRTPVLEPSREELIKEIKEIRFVRSVLKRENATELLDADLKIIKLQRDSSVLPPEKFLGLGKSLFQQKLLLLKS